MEACTCAKNWDTQRERECNALFLLQEKGHDDDDFLGIHV